jgi:predicted helicase
MRHLLNEWDQGRATYEPRNIALVTSRLTKGEEFAHVTVVDKIVEVINLSPNTSNNGFVFPLWLVSEGVEGGAGVQDDLFEGMSENIFPEFRRWMDQNYDHHYPAQEIFGYVYSVLHAEAYRERYAEFLRIDFPRVPFAEERPAFERLSRLGWELVEAHLMRRWPDAGLGRYRGEGDDMVREVRYAEPERALYINAS